MIAGKERMGRSGAFGALAAWLGLRSPRPFSRSIARSVLVERARRRGSRRSAATGTLLLLLSACAPPTAGDQPSPEDDFAGRAKQPANQGARLFIQCKSCHALERDAAHGVGPNLFGIVGSQAGSAHGFAYSEALQTADLVWTQENLDRFLMNPNQFVQGTSMTFAGIPDPSERKQIIEFLGQRK